MQTARQSFDGETDEQSQGVSGLGLVDSVVSGLRTQASSHFSHRKIFSFFSSRWSLVSAAPRG